MTFRQRPPRAQNHIHFDEQEQHPVERGSGPEIVAKTVESVLTLKQAVILRAGDPGPCLMKQLVIALAIAIQTSAALALPCEGSRLAITVTNWSITSPKPGTYLITVDLQDQYDPMKSANGRIFFTDSRGAVIASGRIDRHLQINSGSWTKQTIKSNKARWGRLSRMSRANVSVTTCVHSASFEDGTSQAF